MVWRSRPEEVTARSVLESFGPGARVGDVARRHRLLPSQLTTRCRQARDGGRALPLDAAGSLSLPEFAPSVVDAPDLAQEFCRDRIETGDMVIRVPRRILAGA
ncbi:hypothetical protein BYZ73_03440 [Rhodovulum viride]|uniref:Transposase n=1 Tax=Rhodovulum viride TaxID=1231134 RepID=A0ABX9DMC5_9RHOB|nr:transposase [Rhodovulum viride]RAP42731.1 hypothetical protein BYZ73_03440 [Rhodovulum viride]